MGAGKIKTLLKYTYRELRNSTIKEPLQILMWLPRALFDFALFYFFYVWLEKNPQYSTIIFFNVLPFIFIISCLVAFSSLFTVKQNSYLLISPLKFSSFLLFKMVTNVGLIIEIMLISLLPAVIVGGQKTLFSSILFMFFSVLTVYVSGFLLVIVITDKFGEQSSLAIMLLSLGILIIQSALTIIFNKTAIFQDNILTSNIIGIGMFMFLLGMSIRESTIFEQFYFRAFSRLFSVKRNNQLIRFIRQIWYELLSKANGPIWSIFLKDIILNARNPVQWLRILIGLISAVLYSYFKSRIVPPRFIDNPAIDIIVVLSIVHFIFNEITINAFASEANRIKLLILSPTSAFKISIAKFMAYGLPVIFLTAFVILPIISFNQLNIFAVLLTFIFISGISSILIGAGAIASLPEREPDSFIDQFIIEQTGISSPQAMIGFGLVTLILIINIFLAYLIFKVDTPLTISIFAILINVLFIFVAFIFCSKWLQHKLGVCP